MKNNNNLSNKVNVLKKECYSKLRKYGVDVENKENVEVILEENASCEYMGYVLEELLGVRVMKKIFCWEDDFLASSFFEIGTRKVDIVRGKSLDTLFGEIKTAIVVGLINCEAQQQYISCIANDGDISVCYDTCSKFILEASIKEIINYINTQTYCNEEFEEILQKLGFIINVGEHEELGRTKYIDVSCFYNGAKIWLEEGYKQHTLYRGVSPRDRVEVLYLLNALKYGENIFSDEY